MAFKGSYCIRLKGYKKKMDIMDAMDPGQRVLNPVHGVHGIKKARSHSVV